MTLTLTNKEIITAVRATEEFQGMFGAVKSALISDSEIINKYISGLNKFANKVNGIEVDVGEEEVSLVISSELTVDLMNIYGATAVAIGKAVLSMKGGYDELQDKWVKKQ